MDYKYKFTVIMPVYNVEGYLDESIESVLKQTIGFQENIQIILVNDGSTDGSGYICEKYQKMYPDNIIYIYQENQGVSKARNTGIPFIQGKYVNFFDSDDIWNLDVFEKVWDFFEKHNDKIDVVCCRSFFFERRQGEHNLNDKFAGGDRVIDIHENPEYILLNVTTAFINSDAAREESFDERISIGEDSRYITEIILKKEKYGVLSTAHYNIRKRDAGSSITQNHNIGRYTLTMELYYKYLLDYSVEKYGKEIRYVQYAVQNGIIYRVAGKKEDFMDNNQWQKYIGIVTELVKRIDDDIIAASRNTGIFAILFMLSLKHGRDITEETYIKDGHLYFKDVKLMKISSAIITKFNITKQGNVLLLKGRIRFPMNENIKLAAISDGNYIAAETNDDEAMRAEYFDGSSVSRVREFSIPVNLQNNITDISLTLISDGTSVDVMPGKEKVVEMLNKVLDEGEGRVFIRDGVIIIESSKGKAGIGRFFNFKRSRR